MDEQLAVFNTFKEASDAVSRSVLIRRANLQDKEFHFQNWFKALLEAGSLDFDEPGRNTYPDFRMVKFPVGFEIKGLGVPGRVANYDCNSQMPHGVFRGRQIIYVFGRYPALPEQSEYPVFDLVMCHGNFLNADDEYIHKNASTRGMGSFGDILLRDRKMYVAPTPYGLLSGVERQVTLIVPESWNAPTRLDKVGSLTRVEAERVMSGYRFDLRSNELTAEWRVNPTSGRSHNFSAYRTESSSGPRVSLVDGGSH